MDVAATLDNLREISNAHAQAIMDLAKLEADVEVQWADAYLRSQSTSASGRENEARAATSTLRVEVIRLRGRVASLEATERYVNRALDVTLVMAGLLSDEPNG